MIDLPIDGTLDLHTFKPSEAKELVEDYIKICRKKGILNLRIIHGKGRGTLANIVHGVLDKLDEVQHYHLGGIDSGGWGATLVRLKPDS
ncbi:MAG: DNA mismatch repair protein MutS [Desulfuromonas sp. SDB]|nr:MAG: DNA mismatch repair protein MutS [Desulfuromonas sp. SDB]